jgi:hypothetical protein
MKEYQKNLIIALVISIIWVFISRDQYNYNREFITVFGLNIYPIICWTIGLFFLYIVSININNKFIKKGIKTRFAIMVFIYWFLLIFLETIFYHKFNIHNLQTTQYPGLPLFNCLHAPLFMQITYFLIGILYLMIINKNEIKKTSQTNFKLFKIK